MADALIKKIDKGLQTYYNDLGRNDYMDSERNAGKFEIFITDEEVDIQDELDDIKEELTESVINDSLLANFDENNFPFENTNIKGEIAQKREMLKIIKYIVADGSYPVTKNKPQIQQKKQIPQLTLDTVNIKDEDIIDAVQPYKKQMNLNIKANADLTYFLAVGQKCRYPFMAYMVDSFTRDNSKYHNETQGKTLQINKWAERIEFMKELGKKAKPIETKLEQAMVTYSKRIMQRLTFSPAMKIDDNLNDICKYITAVSMYIGNLIEKQLAIPPFQVDLSFAVNVQPTDSKTNDDDDDVKDYTVDIGNVSDDLRNFALVNLEIETTTNDYYEIFRTISSGSKDFRTKLSEFNPKHKDEDIKVDYDEKTYPQNTRFAMFIDRRNEENNQKAQNKIVLYLYPNDCNQIEKQHVPEIGYKLLKQCIIPKQTETQPENNKHVTSDTDVAGKLITFMFNVEQQDEIRCYIVWNQGTMRFHGENLVQTLPWLFRKSAENIEFIKTSEELTKKFNETVKDKHFDIFYKALRKPY